MTDRINICEDCLKENKLYKSFSFNRPMFFRVFTHDDCNLPSKCQNHIVFNEDEILPIYLSMNIYEIISFSTDLFDKKKIDFLDFLYMMDFFRKIRK